MNDYLDQLRDEADRYFERNNHRSEACDDRAEYSFLTKYIQPQNKVLEIGCGDGKNVPTFTGDRQSYYTGVDLSPKAIESARERYPNQSFETASADQIPFEDESFDFIYLGFFLYLAPQSLLSKIVWQIDRCLKDNGTLAITDFSCHYPHTKHYHHNPALRLLKYNFETMFLGFPQYSLIEKRTNEGETFNPNHHHWVSTSVLQKTQDKFVHYTDSGNLVDPLL